MSLTAPMAGKRPRQDAATEFDEAAAEFDGTASVPVRWSSYWRRHPLLNVWHAGTVRRRVAGGNGSDVRAAAGGGTAVGALDGLVSGMSAGGLRCCVAVRMAPPGTVGGAGGGAAGRRSPDPSGGLGGASPVPPGAGDVERLVGALAAAEPVVHLTFQAATGYLFAQFANEASATVAAARVAPFIACVTTPIAIAEAAAPDGILSPNSAAPDAGPPFGAAVAVGDVAQPRGLVLLKGVRLQCRCVVLRGAGLSRLAVSCGAPGAASPTAAATAGIPEQRAALGVLIESIFAVFGMCRLVVPPPRADGVWGTSVVFTDGVFASRDALAALSALQQPLAWDWAIVATLEPDAAEHALGIDIDAALRDRPVLSAAGAVGGGTGFGSPTEGDVGGFPAGGAGGGGGAGASNNRFGGRIRRAQGGGGGGR